MYLKENVEVTRRRTHTAKAFEVLDKANFLRGETVPALLTAPIRYTLGRFTGENASPTKIDLSMQEDGTSREHAALDLDRNGNLYIIDLDSRNGTYIVMNGKPLRLDQRTRIAIGDKDIYMFGKGMPRYQFRRTGKNSWLLQRYDLADLTQMHAPVPEWK